MYSFAPDVHSRCLILLISVDYLEIFASVNAYLHMDVRTVVLCAFMLRCDNALQLIRRLDSVRFYTPGIVAFSPQGSSWPTELCTDSSLVYRRTCAWENVHTLIWTLMLMDLRQ